MLNAEWSQLRFLLWECQQKGEKTDVHIAQNRAGKKVSISNLYIYFFFYFAVSLLFYEKPDVRL